MCTVVVLEKRQVIELQLWIHSFQDNRQKFLNTSWKKPKYKELTYNFWYWQHVPRHHFRCRNKKPDLCSKSLPVVMLPLTLKMATHVHSNFFHKQVMNHSTCQILFKEMFYKLELSKWEGSWDTTLQKLLHQQERTVSHNVNNDYFRFNCFSLISLDYKDKDGV